MAAPRQSCHSAVVAVRQRAEIGVDVGDQVVEQHGIERVAVGVAVAATERCLDVAALHHHNHRHGVALVDGVVHDVLHVALFAPTRLVLAHTVLQVEHWVAFLAVGLQVIFCRRVDHGMAPRLLFVAVVVEAAHLTGGHTLLWAVVVAFRTFGHFYAARLAAAAEESLRSRVDEVDAAYVHKVVVEAHHERVRHGSPTALAVALHVIFLAADVEHHTGGIGRFHIEIAAALLVDLRELVARHGRLGDEGVGRHFHLSDVRLHLGALGRIAEESCHSLAVAATQFAVTGCIEMQFVGAVGAAVRRDYLRRVQRPGQFVDLLLAANAHALAACLHDIARIERHVLGLEVEVAAQVVIHLLHHTCPLRVARIGLALVHQYALDHAVLLCFFCQSHQALIGVVVVSLEYALHPLRRRLRIALDAVGQESLDVDAADSHVDYADFDILGQRADERSSEPVGRRQSRIGAAQRSRCLAPLSHLSSLLGEVDGGHQQEPRSRALHVLGLRPCSPFHIRLAEAQEDIEIRVRFLGAGHHCRQAQPECHNKVFHRFMFLSY